MNASGSTLVQGQIVDGKYRVLRVLGEGGMGVVYLARSIHTDVDVVIKSVHPEYAHRADIRQRTLDEGKALARIDHPNVVPLKSVVVDDGQLLLVMQYIEGVDLEQRILRHVELGKPMPFEEVLRIFRMVLHGVGAAHDEGVIHRDLKPANILIRSKDGVAKVTDFGIARPEGEANRGGGNTTKGIIGSAHYMAPEQVKGLRDLDRRVDIYALGIMLFQMLTGRVPFDSDNTFDIMRQQIEEPLPSITPGRPDLPPQIDGILQQACAKDRENRFPTCEAFLQRLAPFGQAAAGAPGPTIPAGPADLADTALGAAYPDLGPLMPQDGTTPGLGGGMANPGVTPPTPVGPSGPVPTVAQPMVQAPPGYMMGQAPMGQAPMGQAPMPQTPMPQTPMPMGQPGPMPNTPMPMMGPPGAYGPPTGAMPAHGTITGGASALPPSQPSSKIWIFPAVGAVLFAGVLTLLFTSGVIGGGQKETLPDPIATDSTSGGDEGGPEPATTNPGKPSAPAGDLSHYEGMWVAESGRELRATVVGDRIEFQVVTPSQFAPQPYNAGEARFVLHPVPDEKDHFTVEDRIRPVIPAGYVYDSANARTTCLAVFKEVSATPLKAEVNGDRLDVEFAKVEPTLANFALAGKQIMSCRGLEQLRASKIPGVFHKKG